MESAVNRFRGQVREISRGDDGIAIRNIYFSEGGFKHTDQCCFGVGFEQGLARRHEVAVAYMQIPVVPRTSAAQIRLRVQRTTHS